MFYLPCSVLTCHAAFYNFGLYAPLEITSEKELAHKCKTVVFIEIEGATCSDYPYVSHYVFLGCSDTWLLAEVSSGMWRISNNSSIIVIFLPFRVYFCSQAAVITHTTCNRQTAALPAPSEQQKEWGD